MGNSTEAQKADSYMNGWRAGYHNATLAERERISKLVKANTDATTADYLLELINRKESNDNAR